MKKVKLVFRLMPLTASRVSINFPLTFGRQDNGAPYPPPHTPVAHFLCATRKHSLRVVQLTGPGAACSKALVRHCLGNSLQETTP